MKKKKKELLLGLGSFICLFLVIGVSYALWQLVLEQTNENVVTSGCFKINFTEKNNIELNNAFPIIDSEGRKLTPYEFTIENTCDSLASYQVNLEILDSTTLMKHEYIKVMFDEKNPRILTSYNETEKTLDNATTSYKLDMGFLEGNTSKTFTLRLWMDENTPPVEDAMNKIFKSKVTIITSYEAPLDTTNMVKERWGETDYDFMQDSNKIVFQNTMNPIEGITPVDLSFNEDNSVLAYKDEREEIITYIQANGKIKLPENSFGFFSNVGEEILGLENLDTLNVENMRVMFQGCSSLTNLDLSSFNTSSVINMNGMFWDCSSLTSLDLNSFNTSNVTNMSAMFSGCSNLSNLNLSSFITTRVTDMVVMFRGCSSLTSLDLSSFDTANVTRYVSNEQGIFENCSNLTEIIYGDKFVLKSGVKITNLMFKNCPANKPIHESWNGVFS